MIMMDLQLKKDHGHAKFKLKYGKIPMIGKKDCIYLEHLGYHHVCQNNNFEIYVTEPVIKISEKTLNSDKKIKIFSKMLTATLFEFCQYIHHVDSKGVASKRQRSLDP